MFFFGYGQVLVYNMLKERGSVSFRRGIATADKRAVSA